MKEVWTFQKGLNLDTEPIRIQPGECVYMNNGVLSRESIRSEEKHFSIKNLDNLYGAINFKNEAWIFGKHKGKDVVINIKEDLKTKVYTPILNLSRNIQIEAKTHLDKIRFYCTDGIQEPFIWEEGWEEKRPLFIKPSKILVTDLEIVENAGIIECGKYQIVARYYTEEFLSDEWGIVSDSIAVIRSVKNSVYSEGGNEKVFKAIKFKLSNLDLDKKYVEIAVIRYDQATSIPVLDVFYRGGISSKSMTLTYSGKTIVSLPITELQKTNIIYNTAKTLRAKDNRLFLANLSSNLNPDCQIIADKIRITYNLKKVPLDFYKHPNSISKRTYKRGEVYSFCFIPIYKDGSEGKAYPIPAIKNFDDELDVYTSEIVDFKTNKNLTFHKIPSGSAVGQNYIEIVELKFHVKEAIINSGLQQYISGYIIGRQKRDSLENISKIAQGFVTPGGKYVYTFLENGDIKRVVNALGPGFGLNPCSTETSFPTNFFNATPDPEENFVFSGFEASNVAGDFQTYVRRPDVPVPIFGFYSPEYLMRPADKIGNEIEFVYQRTLDTVVSTVPSLKETQSQNAKLGHVNLINNYIESIIVPKSEKFYIDNIIPKIETSDLSNYSEFDLITTNSGNKIYIHKHSPMSVIDFGSYSKISRDSPEERENIERLIRFNNSLAFDASDFLIFTPNFTRAAVFKNSTNNLSNIIKSGDKLVSILNVFDLNYTNPTQYGNLQSAVFYPIYYKFDIEDSDYVLNGDTYITPFSIRHTGTFDYRRYKDDTKEKFQIFSREYEDFGFIINSSTTAILESSVNGYWRGRFKDGEKLLESTIFSPNFKEDDVFKVPVMLHKGNMYNPSYSFDLESKVYFPKTFGVSESVNFPTRIIYSYFQTFGGVEDAWRNFSYDFYQDIPFEGGEITKLAIFDNILLALSEHSAYRLYTSEKEIAENSILGNVQILKILPEVLGDGKASFGGCADPFSVVETSSGIIWYNRFGKKFHKYSYVQMGQNTLKLLAQDITGNIREIARKDYKEEIFSINDFRNSRIVFTMDNISISYNYDLNIWVSFHDYKIKSPSVSTERLFFYNFEKNIYCNKSNNKYYNFEVKIPFISNIGLSKMFDSIDINIKYSLFDFYSLETELQKGEEVPIILFQEGFELESNCRMLNDNYQLNISLYKNPDEELHYKPKGKYLFVIFKLYEKQCILNYVSLNYRQSYR